ncbi:PD40 domain-containing protein [Rhodohalobacter barkolensis]|uniref:Bacterial surface antigen (D15) domain-containing protein n=1 Tax=Rhodohalobacter barkolensis TaxID=2053187 RepID=A0A2N0VEU0_9BACT|nr:PD40 domain-containing protein [Rhodohalobacter barkolensis]PKD42709.1 hypothetical protein CWD77_15020 [Rhodohalobacter barkolensis]
MKLYSLFLLFLGLLIQDVSAQIYSTQYRLPGLDWQEIQSEQFRVIYPAQYREEAIRSLSILEAEYGDIQNLFGGELKKFPFILNPQNDRSNGFVTPINFRSEVELSPIRGKALSPQSGDWLESVLPHELVHALHFSVNPPAMTRLLGLFSPDVRRSVHSAAPLGLHEGIAVEYESHGSIPGSGRGNYPFFNHQFNSLLDTSEEWSMGQLLHTTDYSLPFNRHYIGGYQFMHWLQNKYGVETAKNSIQFHYKYPFLGYGFALRTQTGEWPASLYREFSDEMSSDEQDRKTESTRDFSNAPGIQLPLSGECRRANRPLWTDNNTLIFYSRFCNKPSGFYLYDIESEQSDLLTEVVITEDLIYNFSEDSTSIHFSRYHSDSRYDNVFRGDLYQLNLRTGKPYRITKEQRLFSPVEHAGQLYALQSDAHTQNLVLLDSGNGEIIKKFSKPDNSSIIQASPFPNDSGNVALIGKINSIQAVWFESLLEQESVLTGEPDIVFENGSIFDLSWHPDGNRLLLVSDDDGAMNIYEYHVGEDQVSQITHGIYNSFEPSYSPDGSRLAFVSQQQNEQILQLLDLEDAEKLNLPRTSYKSTPQITERLKRPLMNRDNQPDSSSWEFKRYQTGLGWLKPRLWIPGFERQNGFDRFSLNFESVDQLNSQRYEFELSHYLDRFWYDLEYNYKGFFPGFRFNIFNDPSLISFQVTQNDQEFNATLLQQSRGVSLKVPFRYYLERNARFSSLLIEPQYFINQLKFLNPDNTSQSYSEFGTRHTLGLRTVFNYNLRQFTRDVQPNSGWVFFTELRYGLNRTDLNIQSDQFTIDANLTDRKGFRGYISTYISPLAKFNQSLRLSGQVITQTDDRVFNTSSLYSDSFSELPLRATNNTGIFDTRYTIPIVYPDDGGLLLPVYLSNIYLVLFSQTVADLDQQNLVDASRSVYGAGIRSRFRLSNMAIDIGISIGWEPTRNEVTYYIGGF